MIEYIIKVTKPENCPYRLDTSYGSVFNLYIDDKYREYICLKDHCNKCNNIDTFPTTCKLVI